MINIADGTGRFTKGVVAQGRTWAAKNGSPLVTMEISSRAMLQVKSFGQDEVDEFTRREIMTSSQPNIYGVKLTENPELPDSLCRLHTEDGNVYDGEF